MLETIKDFAYQMSIMCGVMFTSTIEHLDVGLRTMLLLLSVIYTVYKILEAKSNRNKRLKD